MLELAVLKKEGQRERAHEQRVLGDSESCEQTAEDWGSAVSKTNRRVAQA